jgi:hypothetical protein
MKTGFAWINIDSTRKVQLDSFVTNIPKDIIKNLDKVHLAMHNYGANDEERVWMFYGYFAIHTKYDKKRMYDRKALFQPPEYTVHAKSGVCRDFASLFVRFCDLSNIPCMEISGKVPKTFWGVLRDLYHLHLPNNGHAWNVVKLNKEWLFMDPTWTSVIRVEKYYEYDKYGKKKCISRCKIPDRTYYDGIPQNMTRNHKPYHPAFFVLEKIPSWKTCFKRDSKRDYYDLYFNYNFVLDSLFARKYPQMSPYWVASCKDYSGRYVGNYIQNHYLNYDKRLVPREKRPDLQDFYCHYEELDSIQEYLQSNYQYSIENELARYKEHIDTTFIEKLEKKTFNKTKVSK